MAFQPSTVVLADVSGKGVSAALLADTLQGMIYSQLLESRLVTTTGICSDRRVLRLAALLRLSNQPLLSFPLLLGAGFRSFDPEAVRPNCGRIVTMEGSVS